MAEARECDRVLKQGKEKCARQGKAGVTAKGVSVRQGGMSEEEGIKG